MATNYNAKNVAILILRNTEAFSLMVASHYLMFILLLGHLPCRSTLDMRCTVIGICVSALFQHNRLSTAGTSFLISIMDLINI